MTEAERARLDRSLTPRLTPYTKVNLGNPRQVAFLLLIDVLEILFGGAAGGGKSWGLLGAASQFFDVPGYSALILRRRFRDLALPGALMPVSQSWWANTDAKYNKQDHNWTFPSGAVLQFGYLEHENDHLQYQSSSFQFIGFVDDATRGKPDRHCARASHAERGHVPGVMVELGGDPIVLGEEADEPVPKRRRVRVERMGRIVSLGWDGLFQCCPTFTSARMRASRGSCSKAPERASTWSSWLSLSPLKIPSSSSIAST